MIIRVSWHPATDRIGSRSVAVADDGERWIELWDYNASPELNFTRAAVAVAGKSYVERVSVGQYSAVFATIDAPDPHPLRKATHPSES